MHSIYCVRSKNNDLPSIFNDFPALLVPCYCFSNENLHGVENHLTSSRHHVLACACHHHDEELAITKTEFKKMEDLSIFLRSNLPWSSPLHITPKPGGGLRPCGDFRHLNVVTTYNHYPIPHNGDFSRNLHSKTIFCKIALALNSNIRLRHMQNSYHYFIWFLGIFPNVFWT